MIKGRKTEEVNSDDHNEGTTNYKGNHIRDFVMPSLEHTDSDVRLLRNGKNRLIGSNKVKNVKKCRIPVLERYISLISQEDPTMLGVDMKSPKLKKCLSESVDETSPNTNKQKRVGSTGRKTCKVAPNVAELCSDINRPINNLVPDIISLSDDEVQNESSSDIILLDNVDQNLNHIPSSEKIVTYDDESDLLHIKTTSKTGKKIRKKRSKKLKIVKNAYREKEQGQWKRMLSPAMPKVHPHGLRNKCKPLEQLNEQTPVPNNGPNLVSHLDSDNVLKSLSDLVNDSHPVKTNKGCLNAIKSFGDIAPTLTSACNKNRLSMIGHMSDWLTQQENNQTSVEPLMCNYSMGKVSQKGLRPIIIDGCNVGFGYGKGKFSLCGVKYCADYFELRGHKQISIFLPSKYKTICISLQEKAIFHELEMKDYLIWINGRYVTNEGFMNPYDDRLIVNYAKEKNGVIVTNDTFADLIEENPALFEVCRFQTLPFWVPNGTFMFPILPFGPDGQTLDEMLRFEN